MKTCPYILCATRTTVVIVKSVATRVPLSHKHDVLWIKRKGNVEFRGNVGSG